MIEKAFLIVAAFVAPVSLSQAAGIDFLADSASPQGLGSDFTTTFSQTVNGRLGINALSFDSGAIDEHDIARGVEPGLRTWSALVDWHPFQGDFRFSGGLLHNGADLGAIAGADGALAGVDIGGLNSALDFAGTAPYIGVGWGNPLNKEGRLGLLMDVGVLVQDNTDIGLAADSFESDFLLGNSLTGFNYQPVFSLGVSYQFD